MTDAPTPESDAPASVADLLAASELPVTTAGPAASEPQAAALPGLRSRARPRSTSRPRTARRTSSPTRPRAASSCGVRPAWPNYARSSNAAWTSRPGPARST